MRKIPRREGSGGAEDSIRQIGALPGIPYRFYCGPNNLTLNSGKPCYLGTGIKMYYGGCHKLWNTGVERRSTKDADVFADSDEIGNLFADQDRNGSFFGKSPTLTINSIKPIKRPFRVTLKGADALTFIKG